MDGYTILTDICKAAMWGFVSTFAKHYKIDLAASAEVPFDRGQGEQIELIMATSCDDYGLPPQFGLGMLLNTSYREARMGEQYPFFPACWFHRGSQ